MATSITPKTAARYLVGRTIVHVGVERMESEHHEPAWHISKLALDDGSVVMLDVAEQETEYAVTGLRFPKGTAKT